MRFGHENRAQNVYRSGMAWSLGIKELFLLLLISDCSRNLKFAIGQGYFRTFNCCGICLKVKPKEMCFQDIERFTSQLKT